MSRAVAAAWLAKMDDWGYVDRGNPGHRPAVYRLTRWGSRVDPGSAPASSVKGARKKIVALLKESERQLGGDTGKQTPFAIGFDARCAALRQVLKILDAAT